MECLKQTFAFNQTHFATPAGADFGYADVTTLDVTSSSESPRHRTSLPSICTRIQPLVHRTSSETNTKKFHQNRQQLQQQQQHQQQQQQRPPGVLKRSRPYTLHSSSSSSSRASPRQRASSSSSPEIITKERGRREDRRKKEEGEEARREERTEEGDAEIRRIREEEQRKEGKGEKDTEGEEEGFREQAEAEKEKKDEKGEEEKDEEEGREKEEKEREEVEDDDNDNDNDDDEEEEQEDEDEDDDDEEKERKYYKEKRKRKESKTDHHHQQQDKTLSPKTEVVHKILQSDLAVQKKRVDRGDLEKGEEPQQAQRSDGDSSSAMGEAQQVNKSPRYSTSDNLQVLSLREHYDVERELGRGTYGKVVLARCRHTGTLVALKLLPKTCTKLRDFQREFQLSYFLSPHSNIIDTYNVAFQTKSSFVFAQEHAPLGDLFDAIPPQLGMREADAKTVVKQLVSALDFMHSKHLVHRDIKPENVLVMAADFGRVKLMDFGMTRKHGSMVRKTNGSIPYTPPEVCEAVRNENILVSQSADVWALAVLLFCMLTGNFPWENADIGDMYFKEFVLWQRRKTTKLPSQWRKFTPRAMKLFRKALDVKPDRRCAVGEVLKYLTDDWTQKSRANDSDDESGSSASCDHMDELATMLKDHGIETRVDRRLRERRISEWLLSL